MAVHCPPRPRLQVEQLENRELLAGGLFPNAGSGLLTISGTPFADRSVLTHRGHRPPTGHRPRHGTGPHVSQLAAAQAAFVNLTPGQQLIFQQLNLHRQQSGLPPLTMNPLLMAAAQGHAENMARQDKYGDSGTDGHILDGHDVVYRVRLVGYRFSWLGENVAFNQFYPNPAQTLADQWWNSLPHRANMLESRYTEVGIGIATGASGRTYGVEVFGHPGY
jgi:uncharacterized protein YkwD